MSNYFDSFDLFSWSVVTILILTFLIQIAIYLIRYSRLLRCKSQSSNARPPLSIVVCARNEADNLRNNLPLIFEQDYTAEFEVIVVNDCSSDDSQGVLKELQLKYPNLIIRKLVAATIVETGRSISLGVGIKAAHFDNVVLCDANCKPTSPNWLSAISEGLDGTKVVVSHTRGTKNSLLRADRFFVSINELSSAIANRPYSTSGENMAFHKSFFYNNNGFNPLLSTGDQVERVFYNKIAKNNTNVLVTPDAINVSGLEYNFRMWKTEKKKNWYSSRLYSQGTRNKQTLEMISRCLFFLSLLVAIIILPKVPVFIGILSGLFLLRLSIQAIVLFKIQRKLGEKKLLKYSLFWDWLAPFAYMMVFFLRINRRPL